MDETCRVGLCDLCGQECDSTREEGNYLVCSYKECSESVGGGSLYHQDCLETYLARSKLEKNRKTGFKCPRGCGKGTKHDKTCPGKIQKSHPIHPRNEEKKLKLTTPPPVMPPVARPPKEANKAKAKGEGDAAKPATAAPAKPPRPPPPAPKAPAAIPKAPAPPPPAASTPGNAPSMSELKAAARSAMGLAPSTVAGTSQRVGSGALSSGKSAAATAATSSGMVWGVQPAPPPAQPAVFTLGCNPQLQQMLQRTAQRQQQQPAAPSSAAPSWPPMPVGMDYAGGSDDDSDGGSGLTKAQKKNLKRAEKKRKADAAAAALAEAGPSSTGGTSAPSTSQQSLQHQRSAPQPAPAAAAAIAAGGTLSRAVSTPNCPTTAPAGASHIGGASASGRQVGSPSLAPVASISEDLPSIADEAYRVPDYASNASQPSQADAASAASYDASVAALAEQADADAEAEAAAAQALQDSLLEELCIAALVSHKVLSLVNQLRHLGLPQWLAMAAVLRYGGDLQAALEWLLSAGGAESIATAGGGSTAVLQAAVAEGVDSEVDVSQEIDELVALQGLLGIHGDMLQRTVIECAGDVSLSVAALLEGLAQQAPEHAQFYKQLAASGNWRDAVSPATSGTAAGQGVVENGPSSADLFAPIGWQDSAVGSVGGTSSIGATWHSSSIASLGGAVTDGIAGSLTSGRQYSTCAAIEALLLQPHAFDQFEHGRSFGSYLPAAADASALASSATGGFASFFSAAAASQNGQHTSGFGGAAGGVGLLGSELGGHQDASQQRHSFLWERSSAVPPLQQQYSESDALGDESELSLLMSTLMCR